jgi:hypothetical protein
LTRDEIREQAWQAITNTPGGSGYYGRLQDNVTEFALSLVRRCAEIAEEQLGICSDIDFEFSPEMQCEAIRDRIRREFGLES